MKPTLDPADRPWVVWYAFLTAGLLLLYGGSAIADREFYPITMWSLFSGAAHLDQSTEYQVLVGELADGTELPIRALPLTRALTSRIGSLVGNASLNKSFTIRRLHPDNRAMLDSVGGFDRLERGVRIPDLLRAWGAIYNQGQPQKSDKRLRAIRIDERSWPGGSYSGFAQPVRSWRVELN